MKGLMYTRDSPVHMVCKLPRLAIMSVLYVLESIKTTLVKRESYCETGYNGPTQTATSESAA